MFGKKGKRPAVIQTLVGDDARIEGDLKFAGGCHIDGIINGSVSAAGGDEAYLSVSEYGRVQGNVNVPRLALSGTVEGDVFVTDRVELGPTARVTGNVHYNLIEIAAGAEINGKLIHVSEPQSRSQAPSVAPARPDDEPALEAELAGAAEQRS